VFFFLPAPQFWAHCHGHLLHLCCRQLMGTGGSKVNPGMRLDAVGIRWMTVEHVSLYMEVAASASNLDTVLLMLMVGRYAYICHSQHATLVPYTVCRCCIMCLLQQLEAHAEQPRRAAGPVAAWQGHAGGRAEDICG
jgi:hypothetical protein